VRHHLFSASEQRAADESSADADRVELLRRCREQLPEESRKLVAFRYEDECRLDAIAERLARSASWVSTTLHRIRAALRKCIEQGTKPETP